MLCTFLTSDLISPLLRPPRVDLIIPMFLMEKLRVREGKRLARQPAGGLKSEPGFAPLYGLCTFLPPHRVPVLGVCAGVGGTTLSQDT